MRDCRVFSPSDIPCHQLRAPILGLTKPSCIVMTWVITQKRKSYLQWLKHSYNRWFLIRFLHCLSFIDTDECADGSHDCHPTAYCVNTAGSYYCSCQQSGYSYNGSMCTGMSYSCSFMSTPLCWCTFSSCVCPVIDDEFRYNVVKVAVEP